MQTTNFKKEFNKMWNNASYQKKKKMLRELQTILNIKEAEKKRIKAYMEAVRNENIKAVKKMLNREMDVNEKDGKLGNTALSYAVIANNEKLVKLLLEHGADPKLKNKRGYNSISAARIIGNENIMRFLTT